MPHASIRRAALAALLAATAFTGLPSAAEAAEDSGDVILILDASGSMWGKAGNETRIEAARRTIGTVIKSVPASRAVGLMAYGHRNAGDCRDIQVIVPAAKGQPDKIVKAANEIVPKGRTPITASVRMAAESLRYKDAPATVVLVTDGVETCKADPCALAQELEKSGVNFTAHVIGFGLSTDQGQQVACLAQATGGQYLTASNAAELTKALNDTIVAPPPPAAPVKPAPLPKKAAVVETGFKLKAVYKQGGEEFTKGGIVWRVQAPTPNARGDYAEIKATSAIKPFIELEPGPYRVEAVVGPVRRAVEAEVLADKPTELTVVLDAGLLKLRALAGPGGEELKGLVWTVFDAKKDLSGAMREVTATSADKPNFTLPAGNYVVRSVYGKARMETPVTVTAAELTETDVILSAGVAAVTSMAGGEKVRDGVSFVMYVLSEPKGLEAKREEIAATSSPHYQFKLGAGTYLLRGRLGFGNAWAEMPFTVKANERTDLSLIFDAGFATPQLVSQSGKPADPNVAWIITGSDGREAGRVSGRRDGIWLKPGTYRAAATINRQSFEAAFDVKPGERVEVKVQGP